MAVPRISYAERCRITVEEHTARTGWRPATWDNGKRAREWRRGLAQWLRVSGGSTYLQRGTDLVTREFWAGTEDPVPDWF